MKMIVQYAYIEQHYKLASGVLCVLKMLKMPRMLTIIDFSLSCCPKPSCRPPMLHRYYKTFHLQSSLMP